MDNIPRIASIVITVACIGLFAWYYAGTYKPPIISFDDCSAAGFPILESYPARCITSDGQSFTQDISSEAAASENIVPDIISGSTIKSPVTLTGQARGNWYFEASFPITLEDIAGNVLATAIAQAQGDWMTTDFVPFKAALSFVATSGTQATLVFHKDNPSGLPEHDDMIKIPIVIE